MYRQNTEIIGNFQQVAHESDLALPFRHRDAVEHALADPHFGYVMYDITKAATDMLAAPEDTLPREALPNALGTLGVLLGAAGRDYRHRNPHVIHPQSEEWLEHIKDVRNGDIKFIADSSYWTSPSVGEAQVKRADKVLGAVSSDVELMLSALNYTRYFRPQTMAGAARTLAESPEIVANSTDPEAMPHLSVTNWTIGQVTQHIYEQLSRSTGSMHIIDMCSGTGATLAAITNRLMVANDRGLGLAGQRLSLTGFEATPPFYDQLTGDYLAEAQAKLEALGLRAFTTRGLAQFHRQVRNGEMHLVEGDVVEGVRNLDLSEVSAQDVVVGTVNYGLHRLASNKKGQLMLKLTEVDNSILIAGDLRRNGSAVNSGYFNLANNGPLNAGNIGLNKYLAGYGFQIFTVGVDGYNPTFVDEGLRERLQKEQSNDGFVIVAARGEKALELLKEAA